MPPDAPSSTISGGSPSGPGSGGSPSEPGPLRPVGAVRLLSAFTGEQSDPARFYTLLAQDSVALVERHTPLAGARVADIGGGAGYFTAMFRQRGAQCLLVEPDADELFSQGEPSQANASGPSVVGASVIGDGYWLPLADASMDVCFSSNVLEHVRDPGGFIDEMIRVTRPGGLVYLSYTVWLSPWGGHESAPFHYLGGHYAARRYARKHGHAPKNLFGQTMFPLGVGPVLALLRQRKDIAVVEARPRYYPRWCKFLIFAPGLRELVTWNLLVILRRTA